MSCSLLPATASAEVLYDNLGFLSVDADGALAHGPLYNSFSTVGSTTLTDISVFIGADNPADGGTFTIGLYSDSSTSPGSLLDSNTFMDSALTTSLAVLSESSLIFFERGYQVLDWDLLLRRIRILVL